MDNVLFRIGKIYCIAFFCFVIGVISLNLLAHSFVNQYVTNLLLLISLFVAWRWSDGKRSTLGKTYLTLGIGYLAGLIIFYRIRDVSVDGNMYHLEAIIKLFAGESLFFGDFETTRLYYYPKTIEILFGGFSFFNANIDLGRTFKIFLILISAVNVYTLLQSVGSSKTGYKNMLLSAIIVLNPVVLYQFFTLYVDDVLVLLLINFFVYAFLGESLVALLLFSLLVSAKVSYALFGGLGFVFIILMISIFQKKSLIRVIGEFFTHISPVKRSVRCILAIAVFVGSHQYLINIYTYHNPLYGFIGSGAKDIITPFQPPIMRDKNRLDKFVYTYFSYAQNYCVQNECQKRISFSTYPDIERFFMSYKALAQYDPNLNGFGNMYTLLLLYAFAISVVGGIYLVWSGKGRRTNKHKILALGILYIVVCTLMLPFPRARYFPLLYLLPLLMVIVICNRGPILNIVIRGYVLNLVLISGAVLGQYGNNMMIKSHQEKIMNTLSFSEVYYHRTILDSFYDQKFFAVYTKIFAHTKPQELSYDELENACGFSTSTKTTNVYECSKGGHLFLFENSILHMFLYVR